MTSVQPDVRNKVVEAFLAVQEGVSLDYIIADPDRNQRFIAHCRRLALSQSTYHLNRCLFDAREDKRLTGSPKPFEDSLTNEDQYRFASEMAARYLERKHDATWDHMICDPGRAAEFDAQAELLSPGFRPVQYRHAALDVWKVQRHLPERILPSVYPEDVCVALVSELAIDQVPERQGLYVLHQGKQTLYVGETKDLQRRIAVHREHSNSQGGSHWLWEKGTEGLILEYRVLPEGTSTSIRRVMELELIRARRPVFNIHDQEEGTKAQGESGRGFRG